MPAQGINCASRDEQGISRKTDPLAPAHPIGSKFFSLVDNRIINYFAMLPTPTNALCFSRRAALRCRWVQGASATRSSGGDRSRRRRLRRGARLPSPTEPAQESADLCSMPVETLKGGLVGWLAGACALPGRRGGIHALDGQMPLPGRAEPGDARLDARTQHAARDPRRPHYVPPLRQPPRQPYIRAAAGRGEGAG